MLESVVMEIPWHPMNVCLIGFAFALINLVVAQDRSGFISIDCGIPEGSDYTDATTGISYTSDVGFIDSGVNRTIQLAYNRNSLDRRLVNLRSFPEDIRNCYILRPSQGKGNKYLIRATFLYGNYDFTDQPPSFDLYIGVSYWASISFQDSLTSTFREILHVLSSDYLELCLVNTNKGTPIISSLEVRPINSSLYVTKSGSLLLYERVNFGATTSTQKIRYKDDIYDRIWNPKTMPGMTTLDTSSEIDSGMFQVPSIVMNTAMVPQNTSQDLLINSGPLNGDYEFYFYFYFAEVESLQANQSRKFNLYINEVLFRTRTIVPSYLSTWYRYSTGPWTVAQNYTIKINKTADSTLPPIINAYESYVVWKLNNFMTDEGDAAAMWSIKKIYGVVKRNWQGDPCRPVAFEWNGVKCSNDSSSNPRIKALNLSQSGLMGELAPAISNLTEIQTLDLSYNNLYGPIPEFLAQLSSLRVLNLKGNNFAGPIPALLLQKRDEGLLSLSIDNSATPKKKSIVIPVVASIIAALFLLLTLSAYLWVTRRKNRQDNDVETLLKKKNESSLEAENETSLEAKNGSSLETKNESSLEAENETSLEAKNGNSLETNNESSLEAENESSLEAENGSSLETKNRQLTFSDIQTITKNFGRVLGEGGFGKVYRGNMNGTEVAVKMLSPSSTQGYDEFKNEAKILMNVNHKNLTRLVGYCHEGKHLGIIYEFMANGNLRQHLSEEKERVLCWKERLKIAIDAAQGLEYLHHGCTPSIIHRDVKSTNILLNEKFEAKVADFGLSRIVPIEGNTLVLTMVAGTPGYIDPEYRDFLRLTEKSDVYSFGIVLMEVITGRPPIGNDKEKTLIVQWFSSMFQTKDVRKIADPSLKGNFNVSSVWRAVELAMACIIRNTAKRPTMTYTVKELKDCLEIEMTDTMEVVF